MMMSRKNMHRDGAGAVSGDSGNVDQYQQGYDQASDGAQENASSGGANTGATTTNGDNEVPAENQGAEENQDGIVEGDEAAADAAQAAADPVTTEAYDQAVRDALMADLQKRFTDAQKGAQTSLSNNDAPGTETAVVEIMDVIEETQAEIDKLKQEAANDPQAKQKQMQLAKRLVDMTFYLKTLRAQIADRTKQAGVPAEAKKAFKDLSTDINKFLRNKAEREQTKQSEFFRNAKDGLSQLFTKMQKGAKDLKGKDDKAGAAAPESDEALTPDEKKTYSEDAASAGFDGVAGENDLHGRERAQVQKSVKDLQKAADAEEFAKARDVQKTETEQATEDMAATAEAATDSAVPTPNKQQVRATIHLLMKSGRLNKDVGRDLLKELAEKGVARLTQGAGVMAAKTDEEENAFVFGGLLENARGVLALSEDGGEESADGVESQTSRTGFRNAVCGLATALKDGVFRQKAAALAKSREVTSQATYNGETAEAGQLAYNQLTNNGTSEFVADDETPAGYVSHWGKVRQQLEESGEILAGRAQAADPEAVV